MKHSIVIVLIASIFLFSSCEKVINIDLKNAGPKLVIEGSVDDSGNPATVTISKSAVFSAGNNYPKVSGAVVKITDNLGTIFLLPETATGVYTNTALNGVVGRTYQLSVLLEGKTYTASSTIPRKVMLDSLILDKEDFGEKEIIVGASFTDPVGFGDNIQVVQTINGKADRITHVTNDFYLDGSSTRFLLETGTIQLVAGDKVSIEFRSIDKNVYHYLLGVQDLNYGDTSPENPESNISGNVLGFFSAHTTQSKVIIVK